MSRFILRFTGSGATPEADREKVRTEGAVKVVDSSSRMLLIEASPDVAHRLADSLPGWTLSPETVVPLPDPRPRIRS